MAKKYQERLALSSGVSSNRPFESDVGKRILMKFGWQEGQGLGRRRDGRTECIQAKRREERGGLGAEKRKAEADNWDNWWADCFNNVAKRITVNVPSAAGDTKANDSDSSSDDEQAPAGEAGRVTAVKKASVMPGKLRRVLRQESS